MKRNAKAIRVLDMDAIEKGGNTPGMFCYTGIYGQPEGSIGGMIFMCPCGCGALGMLSFVKVDKHPVWAWDGNLESPTLTPSIQRNVSCKWHGFLTAGEFKEC